jgi:ACR3 family arsenite transporter
MSLGALLATLILLFGFQGKQIIAEPLIIVLLAVPILIQVFFNSGLAYLLNRLLRSPHCVAGPSALIQPLHCSDSNLAPHWPRWWAY